MDDTTATPHRGAGDDDALPPAELPAAGPEFRRNLWTSASELIVDLGYHSRSHFVEGQRLRARVSWLEVPRVVFPVLASAGTALFAYLNWTGAAVIFGVAAAVVIALEKALDPIGKANAHTTKGDRLLSVYKDLRYFRNTTLRNGDAAANLERVFNQLRKRADDVRNLEPRQVPTKAYAEARRQIDDGQANYEDDPLWQDPPDDL